MTDYSTTLHPDLVSHAQAYFAALSQIPSEPDLVVTAGVYVDNSGTSFTEYGVAKTPKYILKVSTTDGTRTGTTIAFAGVSISSNTENATFLALEERGDAVTDDKPTLERLLEPYGTEGSAWATAIADATDRSTRFNQPISAMDGVPAGAPNQDEVVMVAYLTRHFTYDESGAYYTKWQSPDDEGRRSFPDDLHGDYKQKALVEHELDKDNFYCYSVVTSTQASGGIYPATESVIRILLAPDGESAELETVYSVTRRETEARNEHCFFYSHAGKNIAIPASARGTFSPDLATLQLQRPMSEVLAELRATTHAAVLDSTNTKLQVSGIVKPGAALASLPEGVELISEDPGDAPPPADADTSGDDDDTFADNLQDHVRVFLCPPAKLVELSAHADILVLHRVTRSAPTNSTARTTINHAGFATDIGTPVGTDVFVGVVDSGIDGNHPAFTGRIHKVWDQTAAANATHPPPTGRGNNFGQVWDTDAEIQANSTDQLGHGTHVAGTAAGAVGTGFTEAGMAPAAKLVIVKTDFGDDHIRRGVEWCFREAGNKPCVVNLSLGGAYGHASDGVDDFSLSLRRSFRRRNRGSSGYHWLPGRVVCVATGNAGDCGGHAHVTPLATNATTNFPVIIAPRPNAAGAATPISSTRITFLAYPLPRAARGARIDVRVRRGTGAAAAATKWFTYLATGATDTDVIGGTVASVVNGPPPPGDSMGLVYTQHQRVEVQLFNTAPTGIPTGTWTIEVRSRTTEDIQIDGYIYDAVHARQQHRVFFQNATKQSLFGSPAATYGVIATGAMVNRATWTSQTSVGGTTTQQSLTATYNPATNLVTSTAQSVAGAIASFTCPGPARGTRRTIRAMLPGEGILSAMATNAAGTSAQLFGLADEVNADTGQMSGTSMACPVATGLVAGMLGKHATLSAKQVIDRFLSSNNTPPAGWDTDRYGPGPLDASKLLD